MVRFEFLTSLGQRGGSTAPVPDAITVEMRVGCRLTSPLSAAEVHTHTPAVRQKQYSFTISICFILPGHHDPSHVAPIVGLWSDITFALERLVSPPPRFLWSCGNFCSFLSPQSPSSGSASPQGAGSSSRHPMLPERSDSFDSSPPASKEVQSAAGGGWGLD